MPVTTPLTNRTRLTGMLTGVVASLVLSGLGLTAAAPASAATTTPPVVVVGMSGVRWSDVSAGGTPALWRLAEHSAIGNNVVRSVRASACPADGWLALGAGKRSADEPGKPASDCRTLDEPRADGAVPRWSDYVAARDSDYYDAQLGLLGSLVSDAGLAAVSIGPGAAIALASPAGMVVGTHESMPGSKPALAQQVAAALAGAELLVVDTGAVRDLPDSKATESLPSRAEQVTAIDSRVAAVLQGIDDADLDSSTVLFASLADSGTDVRLQLVAASGLGQDRDASTVLTSSATRQDGYVQTTDLLPTILAALKMDAAAPAGSLVGAPVTPSPSARSGTDRIALLTDADDHSIAIRAVTPSFFAWLIGINLLLFAGVRFVLLRSSRRPVATVRAFQILGVAIAALPVSTFLANLVPWWRATPPALGLYASLVCLVALVTALALAPPWGRSLLGPLGAVAVMTLGTISVDVVTGSRLQLASLMGVQPLVAGRFYGLNNLAFSLLAVSSLLACVAVGDELIRRGRRAWALAMIALVGVGVTVLDGLPGLGSDFGGPPALIPAFAVLGLLAAGVRLSWRKIALVLVAGVVAVTAFGVIDWLRPADQRTHLGRFVQTVLDGGLLDVVVRKIGVNLYILVSSWLIVLAVAGIAVVTWVLGRPRRSPVSRGEVSARVGKSRDGTASGSHAGESHADESHAGRRSTSGPGAIEDPVGGTAVDDPGPLPADTSILVAIGEDAPLLRPGLVAIGVAMAIGLAVNDSGIAIPAIGVALGVPLLVATTAGWMLSRMRRVEPSDF